MALVKESFAIRTPNADKLYPKENDNVSAGMVGKVTDKTVQVRKSVSSRAMMVLDFISRLRFTAGKHGVDYKSNVVSSN